MSKPASTHALASCAGVNGRAAMSASFPSMTAARSGIGPERPNPSFTASTSRLGLQLGATYTAMAPGARGQLVLR
jgi:hypothetical protein